MLDALLEGEALGRERIARELIFIPWLCVSLFTMKSLYRDVVSPTCVTLLWIFGDIYQ